MMTPEEHERIFWDQLRQIRDNAEILYSETAEHFKWDFIKKIQEREKEINDLESRIAELEAELASMPTGLWRPPREEDKGGQDLFCKLKNGEAWVLHYIGRIVNIHPQKVRFWATRDRGDGGTIISNDEIREVAEIKE